MNYHYARLLVPLLYMGLIFTVSSIPADNQPELSPASEVMGWVSPQVQNLLHIPVFALLACLWSWALWVFRLEWRQVLLLAWTLTAAYAFMDEWHQISVPGRFASLSDLCLDLLGGSGGIWLAAWSSPSSQQSN